MEDRICAIYIRVSTEKQNHKGYSLEQQEVQCRRYLQLYYPDCKNVILYCDGGFSGKSLERPKMQELLNDIKNKKVEVVVAVKLDRLTRSVIDCYNFMRLVTENDCTLVSVYDQLDISSANGRMVVGILAVFANFERETISERTVNGHIGMARKGKYPFRKSPFGWDKDRNQYLSVNENEAEILNYMADLWIKGYSGPNIVKSVKTKYDRNFTDVFIGKVLKRECNIGNFSYHGETFNNIFPPIMNPYKYQCVLKATQNRHKTAVNYSHSGYMFFRLVRCSCGAKLFHRHGMKSTTTSVYRYRYYYCSCCRKAVNQNILKERVFSIVNDYIQKSDEKQINTINNKLKQNERGLKAIQEAYEQNLLSVDSYLRAIDLSTRNQNKLIHEMELISTRKKTVLEELNLEELYEFLHQIIVEIQYDFDEKKVIKIDYFENEV